MMIREEDGSFSIDGIGIGVCCSFFLINEDMKSDEERGTQDDEAQRSELRIDSL